MTAEWGTTCSFSTSVSSAWLPSTWSAVRPCGRPGGAAAAAAGGGGWGGSGTGTSAGQALRMPPRRAASAACPLCAMTAAPRHKHKSSHAPLLRGGPPHRPLLPTLSARKAVKASSRGKNTVALRRGLDRYSAMEGSAAAQGGKEASGAHKGGRIWGQYVRQGAWENLALGGTWCPISHAEPLGRQPGCVHGAVAAAAGWHAACADGAFRAPLAPTHAQRSPATAAFRMEKPWSFTMDTAGRQGRRSCCQECVPGGHSQGAVLQETEAREPRVPGTPHPTHAARPRT